MLSTPYEQALERIRAEYQEMPGMRLTVEQRRRLERERLERLEKARVDRLLAQARSLREAEEIRAYVSAVRERQAPLDDPLSATGLQTAADWALSQADRIDPVLFGSFRTVQDDD